MTRSRYALALAVTLAVAVLATSARAAGVTVSAQPNRVVLTGTDQRLDFVRGADGRFRLTTFVRTGHAWTPLFDAGTPILQGADFDLLPSRYRVAEATPSRAVVEFSGRQQTQGFAWDLRVSMASPSDLVHFSLACHITKPLILRGLEPQFALFANRPAIALAVNQGPANIYQGTADRQWGNSFPASYFWDKGVEAALVFDMTPMDWMSPRNLFRFHDCRVQAFEDGGKTGFGLRVVKRNFHLVSPGEMRFEAYLYARARPSKPTRLDALDTLVQVFASLHPSSAQPMRLGGHGAIPTWASFARGVAHDLMLRGIVWDDINLPPDAPWRDLPAFPDHTVSTLRVSSDYAIDTASDPKVNRTRVTNAWDFSTCYNYLAPLLAYDRLKPNPERHAFLAAKVRCLPLFFDPKAGLIRSGTRYPLHVGDKEMSWQNFLFALETAEISQLLAPDDVSPTVEGKFLLGCDGLIDYAHRVDYLFPQWFDPYSKTALPQSDVPELGIVYEPWQTGTYAQVMLKAYALSGDKRYLDEAEAALARLFVGMTFRVANKRYDVTYSDPVDFPVTEIFGNAWGVAAAWRLYKLTGDATYRRYSDYFLDSLLRMTYWYESALRDDPKDLAMRTAGLFRNQGGAFTGSPWENSDAYLALLERLRDDPHPRPPLLRMFNLYRVNSFTYFPAVFPPEAIVNPKLRDGRASHLPIEDACTPEQGGGKGAMGRCVYMSGIAFWNWLMFEAFATPDDPAAMVLSLDALNGFDDAASSARRSFLVYNPGPGEKSVRVRMKHLVDGDYSVLVAQPGKPDRKLHATAASLRSGLAIDLPPDGYARLTLANPAAEKTAATWRLRREAVHREAIAYARAQHAALRGR